MHFISGSHQTTSRADMILLGEVFSPQRVQKTPALQESCLTRVLLESPGFEPSGVKHV